MKCNMLVRAYGRVLFIPLLISACGPERTPAPTEEAVDIGSVFNSSEDYTAHVLDSALVRSYVLAHFEDPADSTAFTDFYRRRNFQFAWFVRGALSGAAQNMLGLMASSDSLLHGEPIAGNGRSFIATLLQGDSVVVDTEAMANTELDLTARFIRFAEDTYGGKVRKDVQQLDWFIPRAKKNYRRLLDSLAAGHMDLSPIEPVHPQYGALKKELRRYYRLDTLAEWQHLSLGERTKLEALGTSSIVPELRQRLMLLGDLVSEEGDTIALNSPVYDSIMVKAVQRFQARHGLAPDGVIGNDAMRAFNVTPRQRIRTMLVNMERLRWVPDRYPDDLLLVNVPEFRLHVFEEGRLAWSMDVVVGTSATRTVIFSDTLSRIVFSPYWGVPTSIVRDEILPALAKDPDYLSKKNMERVGGSDALPLLRQRPGASNALGRVKFLFPNVYSIYLHDTPSKGGFARDRRAFSHGCIRLSQPKRLAEYLLRNDSTWTEERIDKAMFGGKEITVVLPRDQRKPVFIAYFTAWVDAGVLNFRDDVYGNDARLAEELFAQQAAGGTAPTARALR